MNAITLLDSVVERPPEGDPERPKPTSKVSRRRFLAGAGVGTLMVAGGSLAAAFLRFLNPNVVSPAPGPVEIGLPEEYAVGSLTFVEQARVYLGRDARGFYAIVAVCTHLGCTPRLEGEAFVCPCHGSRFSRDGQVTNGPAARPLGRAYVGKAANGKLVVDREQVVDEGFRLSV